MKHRRLLEWRSTPNASNNDLVLRILFIVSYVVSISNALLIEDNALNQTVLAQNHSNSRQGRCKCIV